MAASLACYYLCHMWRYRELRTQITDQCMQRYPLRFLGYFRDRQLIRILNRLHAQRPVMVVYSDYPAKEKVERPGLAADLWRHGNNRVSRGDNI